MPKRIPSNLYTLQVQVLHKARHYLVCSRFEAGWLNSTEACYGAATAVPAANPHVQFGNHMRQAATTDRGCSGVSYVAWARSTSCRGRRQGRVGQHGTGSVLPCATCPSRALTAVQCSFCTPCTVALYLAARTMGHPKHQAPHTVPASFRHSVTAI